MGFSDISSTIIIQKKGEAEVEFQAEVYDYSEQPITRAITFKQVIGGMILPNKQLPISKKVDFKFVTENIAVQGLIDDTGLATGSIGDFSIFDEFKIAMNFVSGTEHYQRVFYNALIESYNDDIDGNVLVNELGFVIPMTDTAGYSNYYIGSDADYYTANDSNMGYD